MKILKYYALFLSLWKIGNLNSTVVTMSLLDIFLAIT